MLKHVGTLCTYPHESMSDTLSIVFFCCCEAGTVCGSTWAELRLSVCGNLAFVGVRGSTWAELWLYLLANNFRIQQGDRRQDRIFAPECMEKREISMQRRSRKIAKTLRSVIYLVNWELTVWEPTGWDPIGPPTMGVTLTASKEKIYRGSVNASVV